MTDPDEILKTCPRCNKQDRTSFSTCRYCSAPYISHLPANQAPSLIENIYNAPKGAVVAVLVVVSLLCYFYVDQTLKSSPSSQPSHMIWGTRGNVPPIPAAFIAFFGGQVEAKAAKSIEESTTTLKKNPRDYAALVARGDGYWTQGMMGQALADYSNAIGVHPDIPEAYEKRAIIYDAMSEYDKAKSDTETAEKLKSH